MLPVHRADGVSIQFVRHPFELVVRSGSSSFSMMAFHRCRTYSTSLCFGRGHLVLGAQVAQHGFAVAAADKELLFDPA